MTTKIFDKGGNVPQWATQFTRCIECGTTEVKHAAKGLCKGCYNKKAASNRPKTKHAPSKQRLASVAREELADMYINKGMSLQDIANVYGCSRTAIHQKMKKLRIRRRGYSASRIAAVEQGKITYEIVDEGGEGIERTLTPSQPNVDFFDSWNPKMAYVLGVLMTDGNLLGNRVTLALKDKELVEKVAAALDYTGKIYLSKKRITEYGIAGALHRIQFSNQSIAKRLIDLGMVENKSLVMQFPEVPKQFQRDFIRGCWDGDGSITGRAYNIRASYVCGSLAFVEELVQRIRSIGIGIRKISKEERKHTVYSFRIYTADCINFCRYMYNGAPESLYLKRKHDRFRSVEQIWQQQIDSGEASAKHLRLREY